MHALANGLPLLGDKIYLGSFPMFQRFKEETATEEDHQLLELPRQALHATALKIKYQDKLTTFKSKIPGDLKEWMSSHLSIEISKVEEQIEATLKCWSDD